MAESEQFPHLVEALDAVVRRLGGITRRWRFDRMSTVCYLESGKLKPAFAAVAKYYGVAVDICPLGPPPRLPYPGRQRLTWQVLRAQLPLTATGKCGPGVFHGR